MEQDTREMLPSLKSCDRKRLKSMVDKVNVTASLAPTMDVTKTNDLLYTAAYVITDMLRKIPKDTTRKKKAEAFWKRRIRNSITVWWKDLSKIEEVRRGGMNLSERDQRRMDQKYQLG